MITINLSAILDNKSMTQVELAKLTKIRPSTICDIYNNNCNFLKIQYVDRICKVLKIGVSDLITFIAEE